MLGFEGNTMLLTRKGYYPIKGLVDQTVDVWDGENWILSTIRSGSTVRHIINVVFSNGCVIKCSPDVVFNIVFQEIGSSVADDEVLTQEPKIYWKQVAAQYLDTNLQIKTWTLPIVDGEEDIKYPYLDGAMCAFGYITANGVILDVMGAAAVSVLQHETMKTNESGYKTWPDDLVCHFIPPTNASIANKMEWLKGYITTRSFIGETGVVIKHVNYELLQQMQLLLTTVGVFSVLESKLFTLRHKFAMKDINNYTLTIYWSEFNKLKNLGEELGWKINLELPDIELPFEISIVDVVDIGESDNVFNCVGVDSIVCNGILVNTGIDRIYYSDSPETIFNKH